MQKTWILSLGWQDPLEKGMATHSSILAWSIPWTEEPGGQQSMGSQKSWMRLSDQNHSNIYAPDLPYPLIIDGQSGRFCVLIIINSTAMRPGVHVSFRIMVFSRYMSSSGTAGSYQCMYAESRKHGTEEPICRAGS